MAIFPLQQRDHSYEFGLITCPFANLLFHVYLSAHSSIILDKMFGLLSVHSKLAASFPHHVCLENVACFLF